jgi:hypothetical protein
MAVFILFYKRQSNNKCTIFQSNPMACPDIVTSVHDMVPSENNVSEATICYMLGLSIFANQYPPDV